MDPAFAGMTAKTRSSVTQSGEAPNPAHPKNLPLAHPLQSPHVRRFPDTAPASKNQNVTAIAVPLRVST